MYRPLYRKRERETPALYDDKSFHAHLITPSYVRVRSIIDQMDRGFLLLPVETNYLTSYCTIFLNTEIILGLESLIVRLVLIVLFHLKIKTAWQQLIISTWPTIWLWRLTGFQPSTTNFFVYYINTLMLDFLVRFVGMIAILFHPAKRKRRGKWPHRCDCIGCWTLIRKRDHEFSDYKSHQIKSLKIIDIPRR